ncbi:MAG: SEC-C metal-binding domain-containing protein [Planctomycetota bacterium]|jgi:hypothetical protein
MADFLRDETIATWVGDFFDTPAFAALPQPAKEYAEQVLPRFLGRACEQRDVAPAELVEGDMKPALLEGVGALELPASVRAVAPELCGSFLEELERQGRLGDGRTLGLYVRALADAFKGGPIRNPGQKLGRNAPCPCGSGRKYKQCCMRREL